MIKRKMIFGIVTIMISIGVLGCTNQQSKEVINETSISIPSTSKSDKAEQNDQVKDSLDQVNNTDKTTSTNDTKVNKDVQETDTTDTVTKIEGRRKEFLERLDNIQKELDALPEKKDSDAGVTNAMKNYYGKSYEMYDKALNEIYALLKEKLSPEIMKNLKTKQIKWIEQKEAEASKEETKYKGGTFQFVARYISLYESTKERCYQLVNEYMTD